MYGQSIDLFLCIDYCTSERHLLTKNRFRWAMATLESSLEFEGWKRLRRNQFGPPSAFSAKMWAKSLASDRAVDGRLLADWNQQAILLPAPGQRQVRAGFAWRARDKHRPLLLELRVLDWPSFVRFLVPASTFAIDFWKCFCANITHQHHHSLAFGQINATRRTMGKFWIAFHSLMRPIGSLARLSCHYQLANSNNNSLPSKRLKIYAELDSSSGLLSNLSALYWANRAIRELAS